MINDALGMWRCWGEQLMKFTSHVRLLVSVHEPDVSAALEAAKPRSGTVTPSANENNPSSRSKRDLRSALIS